MFRKKFLLFGIFIFWGGFIHTCYGWWGDTNRTAPPSEKKERRNSTMPNPPPLEQLLNNYDFSKKEDIYRYMHRVFDPEKYIIIEYGNTYLPFRKETYDRIKDLEKTIQELKEQGECETCEE
jgi:hypothetical protein